MHIVAALVYNQPIDIVQFKLFQVGIPPEEVYAEVLPNHKKEQVAALYRRMAQRSVARKTSNNLTD